MSVLEEIKPGTRVLGLAPAGSVEVVAVEWIGDQAVNVVYRPSAGPVAETTLYRDDEQRVAVESGGRQWVFDGDGALLRLVTEANRIKLAYLFDPYLAIHTSLVEPLPHQISAVYGEMLPRQPLRFLLADDPGAGKTIMAGLLIKELMARSDLERCLVVAPGSLVEQWQDELGEKFKLEFDILTRDMVASSRSGNPFNDKNHLIARLDVLARNDDLQEKLKSSMEWDLMIVDEAHRMSATHSGGEVKTTKRYRLGQVLSQVCRNFLLMTATPHNGKEKDFQLFMALLDGDRFEGSFRDGVHVADVEGMMRRLTKEELRQFDGRPLFPERRAYTAKYELSPQEAELYRVVTEYVRDEMNRVKRFTRGDKRNNVSFALQILQRRLASSPAAIYSSLKRRRERLEKELSKARLCVGDGSLALNPTLLSEEDLGSIDEYSQDEVGDLEENISTGATAAESLEQLTIEVETLQGLEVKALAVLRSGTDAKWQQLNRILDNDLMVDPDGHRRKLIIFTEARDTLDSLREKVEARLGRPDAVAVIHGGVAREARRKIVERFMQDRHLLVLVANDAAGEGVNLQRGHLMVNYDLPWNPNKIEQRFGRIHRIGQVEVCHLWNLVAKDTREGQVYARLLEKLEAARQALGGRVYDVLGELFEERALKDLLLEAIQYGEQDHVKARLFRAVDGAVDQVHLLNLLNKRQLTRDTMPPAHVRTLRLHMERAEARRLQPHHVQSFFVEAFRRLGGQMKRREEGRWEITHVPLSLRRRDRQMGSGAPLQKKYERICFEKDKINQQPVAAFIHPGHPLLEAVISVVCEQNDHLMKKGAVLVDETDDGNTVSALFLLEHSVQDGRPTSSGNPNIISQKLQFTAIDPSGQAANAGIAPHLNLRPATRHEIQAVEDRLNGDWLRSDLEKNVMRFATVTLARTHVEEVRNRRGPEIDKVEQEVKARLGSEINHWDSRASALKEQEKAGKKTGLNWRNAERRAEELAERLRRRRHLIAQERIISSQPPRIRGGMIVVPRGLLRERIPAEEGPSLGGELSGDPIARRMVEGKAMDAVMATERALGNQPEDVSAQKVGYDIASCDPATDHMRFIEVKGRVDGGDTVMITRQEVITSLHEPRKFILAIVQVKGGVPHSPRYVYGALDTREPPFEQSAIQFSLKKLLERAEGPH